MAKLTRRGVLEKLQSYLYDDVSATINFGMTIDEALTQLNSLKLTGEEIAKILLKAETGRMWQSANDEEKEYWLGIAQAIIKARELKWEGKE